MAFAVLQAVSSGNLTANTVTFSLSVNGTVNSGDILLAVLAVDGNPTITWDQSAAGTWTALWDTVNGTAVKSVAYWKLADGTEDSKQLKVISGAAEAYAYHISRWSGAHTTAPFEKTVSFSLTASLSVPALQVTTASADYQFVAICVYDGNNTVSTYPTNYINTSNSRAAAVGGAGIGWATRSISGSSVAQARYVLSGADDAILHHVSIRPAPPIVDQTLDAGLVASGLTFYTQSLRTYLNISVPLKDTSATYHTVLFRQPNIDISLTSPPGYYWINITSPIAEGYNTAKRYWSDLSVSDQIYWKGLGSLSGSISFSVNGAFVGPNLTEKFIVYRYKTTWSAETTATYTSVATTINVGLVASGLTQYAPSLRFYRNVDAGLVASGLSFFTQSIALGDRNVNVGLVASGLTHYTPTIQVADVTLNLNLVASGLTHYTPTFLKVTNFSAGLVASGLTHYSPSITVGDVSVNMPSPFTGLSFFTQSLAMKRSFDAGLIGSGLTHFSPSIAERFNLALPHVGSGFSAYQPAFSSRLEVSLGLFDSPITFYSPTIKAPQLVFLGFKDSGVSFYAVTFPGFDVPTVRLVKVTLAGVTLDVAELTTEAVINSDVI